MKKLFRLTLFLTFSAPACSLTAQSTPDLKIDSLQKMTKMAVDDSNKVNTLRALGNEYLNKGDYDNAMNYFRTSSTLAKSIDYKKGEARASGNIGSVLQNQGNYTEATKYHLNAIKIAEEIGDKETIGNANNNIGNINSRQGNYSEALKFHLIALKIREEIGNKAGIASSYVNIGLIYFDIGNLPVALTYQFKALKIDLELDNKRGLNRTYTNIGIIYQQQKSYPEAKTYYFRALDVSKSAGDKWGEMIALGNIGRILRAEGNYTESQIYYLKSLELSEKMGDKYNISIANINFADLYNEIAKTTSTNKDSTTNAADYYYKAINYSNKGLALANELSAKEWTRIAFVNLSDSYRGLGDYKKALEYADQSRKLKDSLLNTETTRKIEQLKTNYEVDKAVVEEKAKQQQAKTQLQFEFSKREDSIKYQHMLTQASLDLSNKQKDLNKLAFLKSQAELEAEQSQRKQKEQQIILFEKEKTLQNNKLALQQTQLELKENQINHERRQRLAYISGIALMFLIFIYVFSNIKSRQRAERLISEERLKFEKTSAAHKMTELELQSLRAQLNPHFMFNSLNAIQELILKEDNDNSHLYLSRFSELLRLLLDNANQPFVPLNKEINLLKLYLSLEKLRIPDLNFVIDLDPSIESNEITIPNMILQPYIENSLWHGLSHKMGAKMLIIRIKEFGNGIQCEIIDNGVGRIAANELKSAYRKEHRSKGMELLSKRFSLLSKEYGSDIHTDVEDLYENGVATGTRVLISIPYPLTEQLRTA